MTEAGSSVLDFPPHLPPHPAEVPGLADKEVADAGGPFRWYLPDRALNSHRVLLPFRIETIKQINKKKKTPGMDRL